MWVHLILGDLSNPWVTVFHIKSEYFSHFGMIYLRQGKSGSRTNPGGSFFYGNDRNPLGAMILANGSIAAGSDSCPRTLQQAVRRSVS